jgi:hypothetical protein
VRLNLIGIEPADNRRIRDSAAQNSTPIRKRTKLVTLTDLLTVSHWMRRAPVGIAQNRLALFVDSRSRSLPPRFLSLCHEYFVEAEDAHHQHEEERDRNKSCLPTRIQN